LITKAADFLSINSKKESDGTLRRLKDQVDELEQNKMNMKLEFI
jgi:hypothetical protein